MRSISARQKFSIFGRSPPLNCLLLIFIVVLALIRLLSSPSPSTFDSPNSYPAPGSYQSYRRLREQAEADLLAIQSLAAEASPLRELDLCGKERENYVPCYNVSGNLLGGFGDGDEFDRHCGVEGVGEGCLVRPPKDYKIPLRWPAGRDVIWGGNVKLTKDQLLSSGSMTKRIMLLEDNQVSFHSDDGAMFDSVKDYSRQIAEMIGLGSDSDFLQAGVRTILDIECGIGSFGAHLLSLNIMTVCLAAYEIIGSQVQLALERGLPAMIGNFGSRKLPYPSLSFDMVHCAQCGITWDRKDGASLFEVDRMLKPGGYFVLTSPTTKPQDGSSGKRNNAISTPIQELAPQVCWKLLAQQDETLIWQKTADSNCYASREQGSVPLCTEEHEAEQYYRPLKSCISGTTSKRWTAIQNISHWHSGSQLSLEELESHGVHPEEFGEEDSTWGIEVKNYWSLLTPLIFSDHPKRPGEEDPLPPFNMVRNVMDMNAHYGGLNAALLEARKSVWVMNVVPTGARNTLPLILDRGFAGVSHNWCEPFPTYPRTYDLLHAMGLLSHQLTFKQCETTDLLLEMDRILRPEGWVILRDKNGIVEKARTIVTQMRWDARVIELQGYSDQRLLVCQKPFLRK